MNQQRILWADDEIDLLSPYIIYLTEKGYDVTTASNGQDAIDLVNSQTFDIIFLDENMPGLSGLETLSEIKLQHPDVPVVMITKSEEENLMDLAIGEKIADYLTKPVNPSQILLCLKKHIHQKEIAVEHANSTYRQEFSDISYLINTASTLDEYIAIYKTLVRWELELQNVDSDMKEMLQMQQKEANNAFAKFIQRNYSIDFSRQTHIFRDEIFPKLDNGDKVCLVVIDNFRFDQWKAIQPLLSDVYSVAKEDVYCSILPTATQYARNAIFSGLMPLQIKELFPNLWIEEDDDEGKNINEEELIRTQIARYRRHDEFNYSKINESDYCEYVIKNLTKKSAAGNVALNVIVLNFIDMLSHSRTESKMMRELANDEAAYRSLTASWFKHSPTIELFKRLASLGYKVVLTTDHGTVRVNNPVQIVGDKNTNTNLRYKVGKALACKSKDTFVMENPRKFGLPCPNISSSYIFATGHDFFGYPNNFNYYAQYYRDTFQHGGISMEEMLIPLITLEPK